MHDYKYKNKEAIITIAAEQWVDLLFAQIFYREPDQKMTKANKKENNYGKRSN